MNALTPPPAARRPPPQLLTVERVRELLTATDPDYGREFTDAEWDQIAERLSALARLIWRISSRRAQQSRDGSPTLGQRDDPCS